MTILFPFTKKELVFLKSNFSKLSECILDQTQMTKKQVLLTTKVRNKIIPARPASYMLSDSPNLSLKIIDCSPLILLDEIIEQILIINSCNGI